jgi:hypothetical protein
MLKQSGWALGKPIFWNLVRKAGLEPASLSALAPKASVFAISPLPHLGGVDYRQPIQV